MFVVKDNIKLDLQSVSVINLLKPNDIYEGWKFNSGNYLFTTDTK